jgi:hypothetical protein
MSVKSKLIGLVLGGLGLLAAAPAAQADSIDLVFNGAVGPIAGVYTYSYSASVTGTSRVEAGDYFVIYDFTGLISGTETTSNGLFTISEPGNVGPIPVGTAPGDNPNLPNVVFTYTGAPFPVGAPTGSNTFLTDVTLQTTVAPDAGANGWFAGKDHLDSDPTAGTNFVVSGNASHIVTPSAVPLPAAAWGGLTLLAGLAGKRFRKSLKA